MTKALAPGKPVRRRALFGALDADGWAWAFVKAFIWFLVIILALGYIPDRAYYFMVSRTLDLGIVAWSPVNLCPAENRGLECPPPAGAVLPWEPSPAELALPGARSNGAAVQIGKNLLYAGGTDGSAPTATVYRATIEGDSFSTWGEGPALPEARTNASVAVLSGVAYLVGGLDADGAPTDTIWSIRLDPDSGELGEWAPVEGLALPDPRAGSAVVPVSDGLVVIGGFDGGGQPTTTVWKSTLDADGVLGQFEDQASLLHPIADAGATLEGGYIWVLGGTDENGASGAVQRGTYGSANASGEGSPPDVNVGSPAPSPDLSESVRQWAASDARNLPAARTAAAAFAANGALYLVGGSDGQAPQRELYWAIPDANGELPGGWRHLAVTDLPGGLADAAPVVAGSTVILIGGSTDGGPLDGSVRASLAPQLPFFQLGAFGVVVPGLQIPGEIGQQLGYLAAAGVGTGNFVILVAIAWAMNHRPLIRGWLDRRRARREREAA